MSNKVAVVILNWNGKNYLKKFLPAVLKHNIDYSVIYLADNNSTDDSIPFVETSYPEIKIVKNQTNSGFAQGYNEALKHIDAEYYVLLNSDVRVTDDWINPISTQEADANDVTVADDVTASFTE